MMKKRKSFAPDTGGSSTFRPQLTSLVDVMAIILVFLIKTFSTEGNLVTPSSDLELPVSTSIKPPKPQWSVEITKNEVMSDGTVIAPTTSVAKNDPLLIPDLYDWLSKKRQQRADTTSQVLLQCDKEVQYALVKKVMYTCSKAKFTDFSILVIKEE